MNNHKYMKITASLRNKAYILCFLATFAGSENITNIFYDELG